MPTYDYTCLECNHRFSKWSVPSKRHDQSCPKCGGKGVLKMSLGIIHRWGKTGKPEGA